VISSFQNLKKILKGRYFTMRGYTIDIGYMGMVDGKYILFACEADYREYLED